MTRTDLYDELLGLANSLDDSVTPNYAALALQELVWRLDALYEFEEEA